MVWVSPPHHRESREKGIKGWKTHDCGEVESLARTNPQLDERDDNWVRERAAATNTHAHAHTHTHLLSLPTLLTPHPSSTHNHPPWSPKLSPWSPQATFRIVPTREGERERCGIICRMSLSLSRGVCVVMRGWPLLRLTTQPTNTRLTKLWRVSWSSCVHRYSFEADNYRTVIRPSFYIGQVWGINVILFRIFPFFLFLLWFFSVFLSRFLNFFVGFRFVILLVLLFSSSSSSSSFPFSSCFSFFLFLFSSSSSYSSLSSSLSSFLFFFLVFSSSSFSFYVSSSSVLKKKKTRPLNTS